MKTSSTINARNTNRGFTLVELLVVMFIIATLSAVGFGVFFSIREGAKEDATKLLLTDIAQNMEARAATGLNDDQKQSVNITNGLIYPEGDGSDDSSKDLALFVSGDFNNDGRLDDGDIMDPNGNNVTPIMSKFLRKDPSMASLDKEGRIVDSWKRPIRYIHKLENGVATGDYNNFDNSFDLISAGEDGEFDTEDDIRK